MEHLIMSKGSLKVLANQKNLLAELTIFAESEQEDFSEVEIVTLRQHLKELAMEQALKDFNDHPPLTAYEDVREAILLDHIRNLRERVFNKGKECVQITENGMQIVVNKPVIGDREVDYAMSLLLQLETFTPGTKQEFGREVKPCL